MAAWEYDNFDLLIETEDDGRFRARVIEAPTGESPTGTFRIPFEPTQLENLMLKLDPGRSGTRRIAADPQSQAAQELGSGLFDAVFSSDIRLTWARSLDTVRAARRGLRLRLRLTESPSIAVLPWELLYDRRQNSYIAQSERTPVVRYLEVPLTPRALDIYGALRILVVVSSPTDLPELDVEAEWGRVQGALAGRAAEGTVHLDRLEQPTLQALSAWLRTHDVHVLHFIGHGEYDARSEDGVIYFTDRYGRRAPVPSSLLGPYLRDHDPLRLVFLNACQSARVNSSDPFSDMAQGLVQQDCVAVVAMQFPISEGAAAEFTGEFYGSVADGLAVDQSVGSGRKALLAGYASEWATPVLFLRDPDGKVFDNIVRQVASADVVESDVDDQDVGAGAVVPFVAGAAVAGADVTSAAAEAPAGAVSTPESPPVTEPAIETDSPAVATEPTGKLEADSAEVLAAMRAPTPDTPTTGAGAVAATPLAAAPLTETPVTTTPTAEPAVSTSSGVPAAAAAGAAGSGASTTPPDTMRIPTPPKPPPNRFVGRIVAVVLVLGLLGYLGWWFAQNRADNTGGATPPITTSEAPPVVSKQVTVAGNTAWTETGVACQPGKSIETNATGTVFHNPENGVGPDGDTDTEPRQFNLAGLRDANHGALVASLDAKPPFTVVGASATYQCQSTGELFLGPNDAGVDNNSGQWIVTVTPSG